MFVMNEYQRRNYLQILCNRYGDFKVSTHKKDGTWTKHKSVMECWSDEKEFWRLDKANNRTLLPNEIVLDLDYEKDDTPKTIKDKMEKIKNKLLEYDYKFTIYFSGSKGYHFHFFIYATANSFWNERFIKVTRQQIIEEMKCDNLKVSSKSMIALEFTPHWKTGKPKQIVFSNDVSFLKYLKEEFGYGFE